MLYLEANNLVGEGNSPAQVSPFQEQLKILNNKRKNNPVVHDSLKVPLESPHVDCSDSPETSEPPYSEDGQEVLNKSVRNDIERPLTKSVGDSAIDDSSSAVCERRGSKDPNGRNGKLENDKSRPRGESNDRLLRFESSSETNGEFRQEVSKLTGQHDALKIEIENQDKVPQLSTSTKYRGSDTTYDNCPLSAASNPIHIHIIKEKQDSKVVASMPRICPPQDVLNSNLDLRYQCILPFSSKYPENLQQPLMEEIIQSSMGDKCSHMEESNRTVQNTSESSQYSFQQWLCCW